jgi:hypothetical protein
MNPTFAPKQTYITKCGLSAEIWEEGKRRVMFFWGVKILVGLVHANNGFSYVSEWDPKTGKALHVSTVRKDLDRFDLVANPPKLLVIK